MELPDRSGSQAGIERALKEAIQTGRLAPGTPLPSSRTLAADLGVARGTVVGAYTELVADGWLTARRGSRTVVAERGDAGAQCDPALPPSVPEQDLPRLELRPGRPEMGSFPMMAWIAAMRQVSARASERALDYGDPRGLSELRHELSRHLARVRAVRADPGSIVVCAGGRQSLSLVLRGLQACGASSVAIEEYAHPLFHDLVPAAKLETRVMAVDDEGAALGSVRGATNGLGGVFVSPGHQFLLGTPLSPARRDDLLRWARREHVYLVEDDYAAEFRYDRRAVAPLQPRAPDEVIYVGTASKALAPGLRISWVVAPPRLIPTLLEQRELAGGQCPALDQLTLAELLRNGAYDRHVRKMRRRYRQRAALLEELLDRRVPGLGLWGLAAGLHALVDLPDSGPTEREVLELAASEGLALHGLATDGYHFDPSSNRQGIVIGFAAPPQHRYQATMAALVSVLEASFGRQGPHRGLVVPSVA